MCLNKPSKAETNEWENSPHRTDQFIDQRPEEDNMIVIKDTQSKVLSVLQAVSGIVERRHTLPILANVLIRKTGPSVQLTTSDLEIQIRTTAELLEPGGVLVFTTARRNFKLDHEALAGLRRADVSAATLPPDFARRAHSHHVWRIERP